MSPRTPVGFERWEPGAPWGDVVYSDGSRDSVSDPDGAIESEARAYGARFNAQPKPAPEVKPEPALSGAASPNLPPSTPSPAPPLPTGAPLTAAEKAPLAAPAADIAQLEQGLGAVPAPAAPAPLGASPAARALASNGVDVSALPRQPPSAPAAPGAAPATTTDPMSPALAAVQRHAPGLVAAKGDVKYEGPDAESAGNIRAAADLSLQARGQAITEQTQAKGLGIQTDASLANQAYFEGYRKQLEAQGQMGALSQAREQAAAKLTAAKQTPIADHPDFPEWFVASSIFGALAGGFAEGFSGGRYKSTTLPMIQQIVSEWKENQRYNKGQLIESLTQQLGDRDSALQAAGARLKEGLADMAESKARFARTPAAMAELKATADSLRAQALDEWGKTQATVMGKTSESLSLQPGAGGGSPNLIQARIRALGYTPEEYTKGLNGKVASGENSPTIAQAATTTKQVDADIALLRSLAAANGGTLPTKGLLNVPQPLIPALSRLGYKPGMAADQALALINTYVTQRAKSYGGVITESDRESAIKEMGASGESFIGALERLRESNNNGIRTALSQQFPGAGQEMLNILLDDSASYGGLPNPPSVPFEKQNATEAEGSAAASKAQSAAEAAEVEKMSPERKAAYYQRLADEEKQRKEIEQRKATRAEMEASPDIQAQREEQRKRMGAPLPF